MKNDTFGKRFRALRTQKGLTQEKIADIFYLNTSSISKYEKDKSMPEIALLIQIADFFGVSVDYLLCRTTCPLLIRPDNGASLIDGNGSPHFLDSRAFETLLAYLRLPEDVQMEISDFISFKEKQRH